jgi:hypothetical protein
VVFAPHPIPLHSPSSHRRSEKNAEKSARCSVAKSEEEVHSTARLLTWRRFEQPLAEAVSGETAERDRQSGFAVAEQLACARVVYNYRLGKPASPLWPPAALARVSL